MKVQIKELEVIGRILIRNILQAGLEWIYADCGKLNLKALIQVRRLIYLWHVLSRDEDELISRIYAAQTNCNNIGDWVRLKQADKAELGITLTDEEIQGVSKNAFNIFVKKKVTIVSNN